MLFRRSSSDKTTELDSRLAAFDDSYAQRFPDDPQPWNEANPAPAKRLFLGKTRWWWFGRTIAGMIAIFVLLLLWLAVTAPLSKSLQPIAPPRITLLASDGTPIARNGAIVDEPVDVTNLPPHVVQAFLCGLLPWRQWPSPWAPVLHKFTVSPKCFDTFDRSHNSKTHGT
jgi:penicillin-binding protein 1A